MKMMSVQYQGIDKGKLPKRMETQRASDFVGQRLVVVPYIHIGVDSSSDPSSPATVARLEET